MDTLKSIMIKYANSRGGGLPLTPEEICNCVVLWAQQYAPTAITINGGEGISINNELVDNNKKVVTINVNPSTINVVELVGLFEGSDTVVVDVNETNDKIEIHLDNEIVNRISKSLLLPVSNPTEDVIPVVGVNGAQRYVPLSSAGTKLYLHTINLYNIGESFIIVSERSNAYTNDENIFSIYYDFYSPRYIKIYSPISSSLGFGLITNVQPNFSDSTLSLIGYSNFILGGSGTGAFTDTVTEV